MKKVTVKLLEKFVGKICTIITTPINRDFKSENEKGYPQVLYNYFMGRVVSIDEDGICLAQLGEDPPLHSYFFLDHVVTIAQEKEYNPSNPEDAKLIEKMAEQAEQQLEDFKKMREEKENSESKTIDPEYLESTIAELNKRFAQE